MASEGDGSVMERLFDEVIDELSSGREGRSLAIPANIDIRKKGNGRWHSSRRFKYVFAEVQIRGSSEDDYKVRHYFE